MSALGGDESRPASRPASPERMDLDPPALDPTSQPSPSARTGRAVISFTNPERASSMPPPQSSALTVRPAIQAFARLDVDAALQQLTTYRDENEAIAHLSYVADMMVRGLSSYGQQAIAFEEGAKSWRDGRKKASQDPGLFDTEYERAMHELIEKLAPIKKESRDANDRKGAFLRKLQSLPYERAQLLHEFWKDKSYGKNVWEKLSSLFHRGYSPYKVVQALNQTLVEKNDILFKQNKPSMNLAYSHVEDTSKNKLKGRDRVFNTLVPAKLKELGLRFHPCGLLERGAYGLGEEVNFPVLREDDGEPVTFDATMESAVLYDADELLLAGQRKRGAAHSFVGSSTPAKKSRTTRQKEDDEGEFPEIDDILEEQALKTLSDAVKDLPATPSARFATIIEPIRELLASASHGKGTRSSLDLSDRNRPSEGHGGLGRGAQAVTGRMTAQEAEAVEEFRDDEDSFVDFGDDGDAGMDQDSHSSVGDDLYDATPPGEHLDRCSCVEEEAFWKPIIDDWERQTFKEQMRVMKLFVDLTQDLPCDWHLRKLCVAIHIMYSKPLIDLEVALGAMYAAINEVGKAKDIWNWQAAWIINDPLVRGYFDENFEGITAVRAKFVEPEGPPPHWSQLPPPDGLDEELAILQVHVADGLKQSGASIMSEIDFMVTEHRKSNPAWKEGLVQNSLHCLGNQLIIANPLTWQNLHLVSKFHGLQFIALPEDAQYYPGGYADIDFCVSDVASEKYADLTIKVSVLVSDEARARSMVFWTYKNYRDWKLLEKEKGVDINAHAQFEQFLLQHPDKSLRLEKNVSPKEAYFYRPGTAYKLDLTREPLKKRRYWFTVGFLEVPEKKGDPRSHDIYASIAQDLREMAVLGEFPRKKAFPTTVLLGSTGMLHNMMRGEVSPGDAVLDQEMSIWKNWKKHGKNVGLFGQEYTDWLNMTKLLAEKQSRLVKELQELIVPSAKWNSIRAARADNLEKVKMKRVRVIDLDAEEEDVVQIVKDAVAKFKVEANVDTVLESARKERADRARSRTVDPTTPTPKGYPPQVKAHSSTIRHLQSRPEKEWSMADDLRVRFEESQQPESDLERATLVHVSQLYRPEGVTEEEVQQGIIVSREEGYDIVPHSRIMGSEPAPTHQQLMNFHTNIIENDRRALIEAGELDQIDTLLEPEQIERLVRIVNERRRDTLHRIEQNEKIRAFHAAAGVDEDLLTYLIGKGYLDALESLDDAQKALYQAEYDEFLSKQAIEQVKAKMALEQAKNKPSVDELMAFHGLHGDDRSLRMVIEEGLITSTDREYTPEEFERLKIRAFHLRAGLDNDFITYLMNFDMINSTARLDEEQMGTFRATFDDYLATEKAEARKKERLRRIEMEKRLQLEETERREREAREAERTE